MAEQLQRLTGEVLAAAAERLFEKATEASEAGMVAMFKAMCLLSDGPFDAQLPFFNPVTDAVVFEMGFKLGRADIVLFHIDGSATVVEAKDSTSGYSAVAAGIGQASLYAAQLAATRAIPVIRRALMWTSFRGVEENTQMVAACHFAGVIPMPMGDSRVRRLIAAAYLLGKMDTAREAVAAC